jgi:phosphatidylserine decarboxylase
MSSLHASNASTKPLDPMTQRSLADHEKDPTTVAHALSKAVEASADHPSDVQKGIHAPMHKLPNIPFASKLLPGLAKLASDYHVGNFVVVRGTDEKFFESMPLYPRCVLCPQSFAKAHEWIGWACTCFSTAAPKSSSSTIRPLKLY